MAHAGQVNAGKDGGVPEIIPEASGHTWRQRFLFAHSLTGPFVALGIIAAGKDLYLLEFGADAGAIGVILLVGSFFNAFVDVTAGALQDKALLERFFPVQRWGRRAPWYFTHTVALGFNLIAFFLPPSYSSKVLHLWFAVVWMTGYWCVAMLITAFEASRVEIYPFKDERVLLEQYCKLTVAIGMSIGLGAAMMSMIQPGAGMFIACGWVAAMGSWSGLSGTFVLQETKARVVNKATELKDYMRALSSPIVRKMAILRLMQGLYEALLPALLLHYLTFVLMLGRGDRMTWFTIGGLGAAFAELAPAPLWSRLFAKSTRCLLYVPVALRIVELFIAPLCTLTNRSLPIFMVYILIWRFLHAPFSFWRVAATAWVCDHQGPGAEGFLVGLLTMMHNIGRAGITSITVLGLKWAGFVRIDCMNAKKGTEQDACYNKNVDSQPESLRTYLVFMVAVVAPILSAVNIFLTWRFPIRPGSELLRDICQRQADAISGKKVLDGAAYSEAKLPPPDSVKTETDVDPSPIREVLPSMVGRLSKSEM